MSDTDKLPLGTLGSSASSIANTTGDSSIGVNRLNLKVPLSTSAGTTMESAPIPSVASGTDMMTPQLSFQQEALLFQQMPTSSSASMPYVAGVAGITTTPQLSFQQELLLLKQMEMRQYQLARWQRWMYLQSYGSPAFQHMMFLPPASTPEQSSLAQEMASSLLQLGAENVSMTSASAMAEPKEAASSAVPQGEDIHEAQQQFSKEPHIETPQDQGHLMDIVAASSSHDGQHATNFHSESPQDQCKSHNLGPPVLRTRLTYESKRQKVPTSLEIWKGDISNPVRPVDILVVSAYSGNFTTACLDSVIRSVTRRHGINFADIAENHCEFNLRTDIGVWISTPLGENLPFRRILCILIEATGNQPYLQAPVPYLAENYHPLSIIYERIFSGIAYMQGRAEDLNHSNLSISIPMVGEIFNETSDVADHMVRASKRALEGECPLIGKILLYGFEDHQADELQRAAIDSISSWSQHDKPSIVAGAMQVKTGNTPPTSSIVAGEDTPRAKIGDTPLTHSTVTGSMQMKTGGFCLNDSVADVILGENDTHGLTNDITNFYKQDVRGIFDRKHPTSVDQVLRLFDLVYEIKHSGRKLKHDLSFWVSRETAAKCEARAREKGEEHPYHAMPQVAVFGRKNNKRQVFFVQACPTCIKHDIKENRVARQRTNGNKKPIDSYLEAVQSAAEAASSGLGQKESLGREPQCDRCEGKLKRKRSASESDVDRSVEPIPEESSSNSTDPEPKRQKGTESSSPLAGATSSSFGWLTRFFRGKCGNS
jgi:hypothetical protein